MTEGISAIGSYGNLGAGLYGSYYNPAMMSMMSGYGSYGMSNPMMSSMGMMGMYNPSFMAQQTEMMKQMYSAQNEIQKLQLQNATEMHAAKEQAQVYNAQVHDRAFFETVAVNGDVQKGIREIYDNIRTGNMDYVAQKYYELKQEILNKYSDHFSNSVGGINDKENIDYYITTLYSEIAGKYNPTAPKPDLYQDILAYGETSLMHGFNSTFYGHGHNKMTGEECLYQITGRPVNDKGIKSKMHTIGEKAGSIGQFAAVSGAGALAGLAINGLGRAVPIKFISNLFKGKAKAFAWLAGLGAGAYDFFWQMGKA